MTDEVACELLESKGIAALVSGGKSGQFGVSAGTLDIELWVVLNRQYKDAEAILADPSRNATDPLTRSELIQVKTSLRFGSMSDLLAFLFKLLVVAVAAAIMAAFLVF